MSPFRLSPIGEQMLRNRLFDWEHDRNAPADLDIWLNGQLIPESALLIRASMSPEPNCRLPGVLTFIARDWQRNILSKDDSAEELELVTYLQYGYVLWRWRTPKRRLQIRFARWLRQRRQAISFWLAGWRNERD